MHGWTVARGFICNTVTPKRQPKSAYVTDVPLLPLRHFCHNFCCLIKLVAMHESIQKGGVYEVNWEHRGLDRGLKLSGEIN